MKGIFWHSKGIRGSRGLRRFRLAVDGLDIVLLTQWQVYAEPAEYLRLYWFDFARLAIDLAWMSVVCGVRALLCRIRRRCLAKQLEPRPVHTAMNHRPRGESRFRHPQRPWRGAR